MKWILRRLSYEVDDNVKARHKLENISDLILVLIYLIISLYNAFSGAGRLTFGDLDGNFKPDEKTIATMLTVFINIIVTARLYIRLFVQLKDDLDYLAGILDKDQQYDKIIIEASESRIKVIKGIFLIIMAWAFVLLYIGDSAVSLIPLIVTFSVGLSCINDIIDIVVNMYNVKLKPARLNYFEWR